MLFSGFSPKSLFNELQTYSDVAIVTPVSGMILKDFDRISENITNFVTSLNHNEKSFIDSVKSS